MLAVIVTPLTNAPVLNCLSAHMPFWERKIDLVILTHPHADHFTGLYYVLDRYITLSFASERLSNSAQSFQTLMKIIGQKKLPERFILAGDKFKLGGNVALNVVAPSQEMLIRASPNGNIGDSGELASLIMKLTYKDFDLLLTGDAQTKVLEDFAVGNTDSIEVLQVPHHGSDTGLDREGLDLIAPKLAVISVGANNRYGHPKKSVLSILKEDGVKTLRTDQKGDIEIISDGKKFWVK